MVRSAGWRHVVGASLLPAGVKPLLGVPAAVIGAGITQLSDLIGRAADQVEDRVFNAPPTDALRHLAQVLLDLAHAHDPEHGIADRAVGRLRSTGGTLRIDELAGDLSVSTRRLERHFLTNVGLSPKLFARLVRFDRAVRDLALRGEVSWARFATDHGYSDQAHFINEFREFAGITPVEFEAESRDGPDPGGA
jgi:transcriptional regulator GlxA family with amidase domain